MCRIHSAFQINSRNTTYTFLGFKRRWTLFVKKNYKFTLKMISPEKQVPTTKKKYYQLKHLLTALFEMNDTLSTSPQAFQN
jgi:hypothetical protein